MANNIAQRSHDWLQSPQTNLLAWWIPWIAIIAGLLAPVPVRTAIWIVALSWMGTACTLNAKRCGRTHCRYTGSRNERASSCAWFWPRRRRHLRLAGIGRRHSARKQAPLVGDRACLGQIFLRQNVQVRLCPVPGVFTTTMCNRPSGRTEWRRAPCR